LVIRPLLTSLLAALVVAVGVAAWFDNEGYDPLGIDLLGLHAGSSCAEFLAQTEARQGRLLEHQHLSGFATLDAVRAACRRPPDKSRTVGAVITTVQAHPPVSPEP
jgi:hypothetical protein